MCLVCQHPDHNDLCSQANSNVDIDDISLIKNFSFKTSAKGDLLINFLVSLFTSYKNFTSVRYKLGMICVKLISSFFTIKSHKESLSPTFLFLALVVTTAQVTFSPSDIIIAFVNLFCILSLFLMREKTAKISNKKKKTNRFTDQPWKRNVLDERGTREPTGRSA